MIHLNEEQLADIHEALAGEPADLLVVPLVAGTPYYRKWDYTFSDVDSRENKANLLLLVLAAEGELKNYSKRAVRT